MATNNRVFTTESLSGEIADAARDLANRISFGEFDDLDDGQMMDLRCLSDMMGHWGIAAQALEERLIMSRGTLSSLGGTRPAAFLN